MKNIHKVVIGAASVLLAIGATITAGLIGLVGHILTPALPLAALVAYFLGFVMACCAVAAIWNLWVRFAPMRWNAVFMAFGTIFALDSTLTLLLGRADTSYDVLFYASMSVLWITLMVQTIREVREEDGKTDTLVAAQA